MREFRSLFLGLCIGLVLTATGPALAQTSDDREMDDAVTHAYANGLAGPAAIPLRDLGILNLPKDYVFVPAKAGRRLMHGMGNGAGDALIGLVVPSQYSSWFIVVEVLDTGHVDQTALLALDHEDIRGAIAASTRRGNESRMRLGSAPIDAGAFLEPPLHDAARGSFTTAIRIYESGPSSGGEDSANVDAYLFGRSHTLQISLIDGVSGYDKHRLVFNQILKGVAFVSGQRAEDYVASRDPAATHLIELLFGGRTVAEIAAEAAADAAEAKRIAALPPPKTYSREIQLAFFGALGLAGLLLAFLAVFKRGGGAVEPQRDGGIDRALRTAPRR